MARPEGAPPEKLCRKLRLFSDPLDQVRDQVRDKVYEKGSSGLIQGQAPMFRQQSVFFPNFPLARLAQMDILAIR